MARKKLKFSETVIINYYKKEIIKPIVKEILDEAFLDFQMNSPVKTWEYMSGLVNLGVFEFNDSIKWILKNKSRNAKNVEWGWRKTTVNWHLKNWNIKTAKWARVFEDWIRKARTNLINKLKEKLW